MTLKIKKYFASKYPEHEDLFLGLTTLNVLKPSSMPLSEAVVKVITGQMLSGAAAATIYKRIASLRENRKLDHSWQLDFHSLRSCGLSSSKANTVIEFGCYVAANEGEIDRWLMLSDDCLFNKIKSFRGMGEWSAGILALFYLARPDIFPTGDASLNKVIKFLNSKGQIKNLDYLFDPQNAKPYRSYLALYLWQALDQGKLKT